MTVISNLAINLYRILLFPHQIEGENFNGSIGLSIYKDKELFRPLNETKEKLLSYTVASVTTEFESRDINVNLSFPLMMECNTT